LNRSGEKRRWRAPAAAACLALGLLAAGCRQDMHDQPKYKPLARSDFFADQRASRPLVEGTISRSGLREDTLRFTGKVDGKPADLFPFPVTAEVMARGRERFDIFCSPCHGRTGAGDGMVVRRGFRRPPTFHQDRLRQAPAGYVFDVITNGFGLMPDHAQQIPVDDRWAIVAYLRALQRSQEGSMADVPPSERAGLGAPGKR
jgi:mono/diheme cytochrome c family protein